MKHVRGQALIELAVCLPVVLVLALGTVAVVQVVEASSGLQAATDSAVSAAARAADPQAAAAIAQSEFAAVASSYPLRSAVLVLTIGGFGRGSLLTAVATAYVDVGWEAIALLPARVQLQSRAVVRVEYWRTHR